ncbi:MAG: creatininase family protein [Alphaproteobacteria bacterium]
MSVSSGYWRDLTTADFAALDAERTVALLPIAAIEQHGPHLPVSVDSAINEALVNAAVHRAPPDPVLLALPMQSVGYSIEHMRFPGTVSLSADTLARICVDIGDAVAAAGLRRFLIFNSHGGQTQIMRTVIRELRARHGMLAVAASWFDLVDLSDLFEAPELSHGIHAGAVETSVMLHIAPERVRMELAGDFPSAGCAVAENSAHLTATAKVQFGWEAQDLHPSGAVGDAAQADAERGRIAFERGVDGLLRLVRDIARFDLTALRPGPRQ